VRATTAGGSSSSPPFSSSSPPPLPSQLLSSLYRVSAVGGPVVMVIAAATWPAFLRPSFFFFFLIPSRARPPKQTCAMGLATPSRSLFFFPFFFSLVSPSFPLHRPGTSHHRPDDDGRPWPRPCVAIFPFFFFFFFRLPSSSSPAGWVCGTGRTITGQPKQTPPAGLLPFLLFFFGTSVLVFSRPGSPTSGDCKKGRTGKERRRG